MDNKRDVIAIPVQVFLNSFRAVFDARVVAEENYFFALSSDSPVFFFSTVQIFQSLLVVE